MPKRMLVLVLALPVFFAAAGAAAERPARDIAKRPADVEKALSDRRTGAFERTWLLRDRGLLHLQAGRAAAAAADFGLALDIDPQGCPAALRLRGLTRFLQGRYAESALDFEACGVVGQGDSGDGLRPTDPDSDWGFAPRVWLHLARQRAGQDDGETDVLGDYLGYAGTVQAQQSEAQPIDQFGCCVRLVGLQVDDDSDDPGASAGPVHDRRLALLFLGRCRPDEYYTFVGGTLDAMAAACSDDDPEGSAEQRARIRWLDAVRAFYLGEYWLLNGDRQQAERWLARAADYDGPLDPDWPLVGQGGLAAAELARLRGQGVPG